MAPALLLAQESGRAAAAKGVPHEQQQEEQRLWRTDDYAGVVGNDDDDYDDHYGMLNFRPGFGDDDDDRFPYETITICVLLVFLAMCLYGLSKLVLPYVPATTSIHRGFLMLRMHIALRSQGWGY
ncbi:hypothetical protein E2562_008051 [Oryza meyeriana var. granulata]|uniref:Uncharacterized protein n=1 Tax=Oryza meyeriana var. granulata TaxID=110450 RepID=A0A6G1DFU3_9ORYZ|nr:hypothetical protein E2562_008051 [Oryza meyeriana var. granulata]